MYTILNFTVLLIVKQSYEVMNVS